MYIYIYTYTAIHSLPSLYKQPKTAQHLFRGGGGRIWQNSTVERKHHCNKTKDAYFKVEIKQTAITFARALFLSFIDILFTGP